MKKLILICLLILFIPLVMAVPPFQSTLSENANLEIVYPKVDIYGLNEDLVINWFVVNSSGYVLNASAGKVLCWYGVENDSNDVLQLEIAKTTNFYFSQPTYANKTGIYGYEIHCNSSKEFGYISAYYYVTNYGKNFPPGDTGLSGIVIIIGIFATSILLLYLAFNMDKEKHKFLQLIVIGFVIGISILIPKAAMDYTNNLGTAVIFFTAMTWFIRVFWVYMLFYLLYEFAFPFIKDFRSKRK